MYIGPQQLRANLEALDSETLRAKLRAGQLTQEAREVANAVLAARGQPEERTVNEGTLVQHVMRARPQAAPLPGRFLVLLAFRLYLAFVVLCAVLIFADPPWSKPHSGTWEGMIGSLAAMAAGLPWTYAYLRSYVASNSVGVFMVVMLLGVLANVVLFVMYLRRT